MKTYKFVIFDRDLNYMGLIAYELSHYAHVALISDMQANIAMQISWAGIATYRIILK